MQVDLGVQRIVCDWNQHESNVVVIGNLGDLEVVS